MTEIEATKKLHTIRPAAKAAGVPEFALRGWIKEGKIKHVKSGNRVYLTLEAILEFIGGGAAQ